MRKSSKIDGAARLAHKQLAIATIVLLAAGAAALFALGRITQDESYHAFADRRAIFGIANFWNVVSNLAFAFTGALGLARARSFSTRLMFAGVFLVALGSGYYHWSPDDARLIWDRLPMTVVFMTLFALVTGERFASLHWLTIPLVLFGIASVVAWRITGDLRPYAFVQFAPMILIPVMLLIMPKSQGLWWVVLFYALAKIAESADARIYAHFPLSGHTLKHLFAAAATWFLVRWSAARESA